LGLVAIALAVSPITLDPVLEVGSCVSSTSLVDAVYVGAWRRLRYAVPAVQASRISAITRQCWPTMRRRASFSSTDTPGLGVRSACGPTPSGTRWSAARSSGRPPDGLDDRADSGVTHMWVQRQRHEPGRHGICDRQLPGAGMRPIPRQSV